MLLQHPETVTGVVLFDRVYREGVSEPVRTHVVGLPRFRVDQLRQAGPLATFLDYLPGTVSIDAEDEPATTSPTLAKRSPEA